MNHPLNALLLLASCGFAASSLNAQPLPDPPQRGDRQWLLPVPELIADAAIPNSEQALRYRWGDDISSHYQIETYIRKLADAAPGRAKLVKYGKSYEGRSLNYLVITSTANMARLDQIREDNLALGLPNTDADRVKLIVGTAPVIVWLAYAVHGNEISPSDAAMLTAYHLLADERPETKELLEKVVVVIDPIQNPDGRDRFVNVYRETRGLFQQSYPNANEHTERWPSGRSNHYWFDMNRDWFRHSQQEVQSKVAAYLKWQPQMYVDAHEMGANSSFYFPPPTDPKNPYLMPAQHEWFGKLGQHQAGWFDRYGFGYMTREVFDAFYPGYGSEWPTLQGGLGVLWEQASARGAVIDRDDETQLTYHDGVRNHYISGLATLEFAAANKQLLLEQFRRAKMSAIDEGREGKVQHYFFSSDNQNRATQLAELLVRNGIEVGRLVSPLACEATNIRTGVEAERTISSQSYHVAVAQPTSRLIRALMERTVPMDDKFLRRQLERNQLRLPDEIYDVTAWSLPLAFDVDCFSAGAVTGLSTAIWPEDESAIDSATNGVFDVPPATVAYLIPGNDGAVRMAAALIQQGIRLHVADEAFRLGGRTYDPGTLIAKVAENTSNLRDQLHLARQDFNHVEVIPTDTAYVESGAHMGGPNVYWVKPPTVLLVVNSPTNYSSGHTWHLFDQVLSYPTTRVTGEDFGSVDLSKFNTVVLPDGNYSSDDGFGELAAKRLADWMSAGGTLITLRGATKWAASEENELLKNKLLKRELVPVVKSNEGDSRNENDPTKVTPDNVPGAFFHADVFTKHWVTFSYRPELEVFYSGRVVLSPTQQNEGRSVVTFAKRDQLLTSGFCWPESLDLIAETPYVVYRSVGDGHLISFADDPNYRAMYPSLQRLFINAAMFGAGH